MTHLFRRRPQPEPSFAARAEQARLAQDRAWATYLPNIVSVGFVR